MAQYYTCSYFAARTSNLQIRSLFCIFILLTGFVFWRFQVRSCLCAWILIWNTTNVNSQINTGIWWSIRVKFCSYADSCKKRCISHTLFIMDFSASCAFLDDLVFTSSSRRCLSILWIPCQAKRRKWNTWIWSWKLWEGILTCRLPIVWQIVTTNFLKVKWKMKWYTSLVCHLVKEKLQPFDSLI